MAEQHVSPRNIKARLKFLEAPDSALAAFAGISRPSLSLWLAGERGLSLDSQLAVLRAMKFFEDLAASTDAPVDFSNTVALQKYWTKFCKLEVEDEIVRTNAELEARAETEGETATQNK